MLMHALDVHCCLLLQHSTPCLSCNLGKTAWPSMQGNTAAMHCGDYKGGNSHLRPTRDTMLTLGSRALQLPVGITGSPCRDHLMPKLRIMPAIICAINAD